MLFLVEFMVNFGHYNLTKQMILFHRYYNFCLLCRRQHVSNINIELDGLPSTVMPPSVVTLTFDLLTRKPNQYVSRPRYICDLILVKLPPIVTKILYSPGSSGHCLL